MADFQSLAAAGRSLERFLNHCFDQEEPVGGKNTRAVLVRSADLAPGSNVIPDFAVSIFLSRVDYNRTMRAAWSGVGSQDGRAHLPLDLYFLRGRVKAKLALVRGKQQHDKREDLKKKDAEREMARALRTR